MATKCIIATPYSVSGPNDTWRGRLCHYEGEPSHTGAQLSKILYRDGYQKAVETLVNQNREWSMLNVNAPEQTNRVEGYGITYTISDQAKEWHDNENLDAKWAYVIHTFAIVVYLRLENKWEFAGLYDWLDGLKWNEIEVQIGQRFSTALK